MGPNIYQSRNYLWSWAHDLSNILNFKWWTTRATTITMTYYSVKHCQTPHRHSLRRFSSLDDAISSHELEVRMLFVHGLDAHIVSHACVPAWRNAYNNCICKIKRALHLKSVAISTVYPFALHPSLAVLLSKCVLTQSLDCSLCPPFAFDMCFICVSCVSFPARFRVLVALLGEILRSAPHLSCLWFCVILYYSVYSQSCELNKP